MRKSDSSRVIRGESRLSSAGAGRLVLRNGDVPSYHSLRVHLYPATRRARHLTPGAAYSGKRVDCQVTICHCPPLLA